MTGISENIAAMRKKKNVTQEELGKALCVSMQAVSRWENGGTPDIMLLPALADYFSVSIDELFGREGGTISVENAIVKYLSSFPGDKRINEAFRLCWTLQQGISGNTEFRGWDDFDRYIKLDRLSSRMDRDDGVTEMNIGAHNWYFISPEPENGRYDQLYNKEAHTKLFRLLSEPDAYDAFMLIFTRFSDPYTAKLLVKRLKIPEERAVEILKAFEDMDFLYSSNLELDDESITIYNTTGAAPYVIAFMALTQQIITPPHGFVYNTADRKEPYFRKKEERH